jgi:hypothetical protein
VVHHIAGAELAEQVGAEATDLAVCEQHAGVLVPGVDGDGRGRTQEHARQLQAELAGFVATVLGVSESELARFIGAPAPDTSIVEQRATVPTARAHGDRRPIRTEVDRRQRLAQLAGLVAAIFGVAETELARAVAPPAFDAPVAK